MHSHSRCNWGFVWIECEACTHRFILDVQIVDDELLPTQSEHCPECGANFDLDLFAADVVAYRS